MRLSELVERMRYTTEDPELMVEDKNGIPQSVTDVDIGVMATTEHGVRLYVALIAEDGAE